MLASNQPFGIQGNSTGINVHPFSNKSKSCSYITKNEKFNRKVPVCVPGQRIRAYMLAALVSTTATMCVSPPFFVCLASPSILLVFFCVFYFALPQLCTLLGFFSFSWFPFFGSDSP